MLKQRLYKNHQKRCFGKKILHLEGCVTQIDLENLFRISQVQNVFLNNVFKKYSLNLPTLGLLVLEVLFNNKFKMLILVYLGYSCLIMIEFI